ncbi:MAG: OprO/OprP family phosphate-selective porin [Gammaproteobacteria bacterium]|nr:OprO/OprP family phosphate-selective porin [Gammaproteobacteria bacterium]
MKFARIGLVSGLVFVGALANAEESTQIGGYGELHYNNIEKPVHEKARETLDFHRFVLFLDHEFSDTVRFFSEVELEHSIAGDDKSGEIELEQAYIEIDLQSNLALKAGLFLVPVGIINETHEPPAFYGVERNPVEKNIIPATWWESGVMLSGLIGEQGFSYDVAYHTGLAGGTNIRSGRQKSSKANAENKALTGRLKFTGVAGLELATSLQVQEDLDQVDGGVDEGVLLEVHGVYQSGPLTLKGLYARWDIDGDKDSLKNDDNIKKDEQVGLYVESSYKISDAYGAFARFNVWEVDDNETKTQTDIGVNYWPHEDVVIKADVQLQNGDAGNGDGFNLGLGYQF